MRFAFWPASTVPWSEVLEIAKRVESTGWDGFYFCDHFMPAGGNLSQPWAEVWTILSAVGALVPRVRLGTLVCGNTYRHPAVLAKMAATLDHVTGGRCVLGLGAGWQENEHTAYGIPFYTLRERLARFGEACELIQKLFTQERASFEGKYYQLRDAVLAPKPVQRPLPLLVGGGGEKVTLRIAARFANEWNVWGDAATLTHKMKILDGYCAEYGRDPRSIERSAVALLLISDDKTLVENVRRASGRRPLIGGNPEQVAEIVRGYRDAGVDELILPDFTLGGHEQKLETIERFMREVVPLVR